MRIVGGLYRGKKLKPPVHEGTRPTSDRTRETIFNILLNNPTFGPHILREKAVLDVFAGTGALGLEALSRGAQSVTFIESNKDILPILRANIKAFDHDSLHVVEQDARSLKSNPTSPFDLVFMDPPYHQSLVLPALTQLLSQGWIGAQGVVLIEVAKDETLRAAPFPFLDSRAGFGCSEAIVLLCCNNLRPMRVLKRARHV